MSRIALSVFTRILLALTLIASLAACEGGPDRKHLTETVQARLDSGFPPGTFALTSLRRLGSGPLGDDAQGRARRIVYFNTSLTLGRDLDFSSWDGPNIAAFANLLGATEKGVHGLSGAGNHKGDRVRVHGSATYVREGDAWSPVEAVFPAVGTPSPGFSPEGSGASRRMIERIGKLLERRTADPRRQGQIITEELGQAYTAISLRLDRLDRDLIVVGGPAGGEYLGVADLLAKALIAAETPASALETAGSPENLRLLRERKADLALVQNNVADQAQLGTGAFAQAGPDYELRALASLFPEPIHLLVVKGSAIAGLADLTGKRVEIGRPDSGSRANSIAVLAAAGVGLGDLGAIAETGLDAGLARLAAGELDAVIATIGAPARRIQEAAALGQIRLLSLSPEVQDALIRQGTGLVPIELPAATYPGQRGPVQSVAATALLVAPAGLPKADVDKALTALFQGIDFVRAGSAAGSRITLETANLGLTVPLHPAAIAFFARAAGQGGQRPGP